MYFIYLGCFVDPSQEQLIVNEACAEVTISTTTFQKAFLSGFEHSPLKPYIINAPDIGSWPKRCKRLSIPSSRSFFHGMICDNVGYCNITLIKQKSIYYSLKKRLKKKIALYKGETVIIIVYSLIYPYLKAAIDIKKEFPNVKVSCIVLDLPEFFGDNTTLLYRLLGGNTNKTYRIAKEIDSYVLLTEYMRDPLQINNKPWLLMEGVYDPRPEKSAKKHSKTVLYTGKLDSRFGIRELVDNFTRLKGRDYQLWICGSGADCEYVVKKAKEDTRIHFFGLVKQDKVFEMQKEASLLINPRKPEGEYTKYSFPSKTMEYMASGTPTLMYHLPGMPKDYEDKVVLFKDSSDNTFCDTLEEWLNKPQYELDAFGEKARTFILENKTAEKQITRFVDFITEIYGK